MQYDGSKLIGISKVDDEKELSQPPFSLMHFGVQTFSGKFRPEDPVTIIKVSYKDEDTSFQNNEEKCILESFPEYLRSNDPDIIVYTGNTVLQHLFTRAQKLGLNLQLGREDEIDYDQKTLVVEKPNFWKLSEINEFTVLITLR